MRKGFVCGTGNQELMKMTDEHYYLESNDDYDYDVDLVLQRIEGRKVVIPIKKKKRCKIPMRLDVRRMF